MTSGNQMEFEHVRAVAKKVGQRAAREPEFLQALRSDPVETMIGAGMPASGIADFLIEEGWDVGDVQGYLAPVRGGTATLVPSALGTIGGPGVNGDCYWTCLCASGGSGCCVTLDKLAAELPQRP